MNWAGIPVEHPFCGDAHEPPDTSDRHGKEESRCGPLRPEQSDSDNKASHADGTGNRATIKTERSDGFEAVERSFVVAWPVDIDDL